MLQNDLFILKKYLVKTYKNKMGKFILIGFTSNLSKHQKKIFEGICAWFINTLIQSNNTMIFNSVFKQFLKIFKMN